MKEQNGMENKESLKPIMIAICFVLVILIGYFTCIFLFFSGWSERGQFGDMFGAANTFFSGLAFAALTYALHLQRRELALQRIELSLTRNELSKQTNAQSQQAETALKAAKISALGALLQTYAQFIAAENYHLVSKNDWQGEIKRVKNSLIESLEQEK